MSNKFHRLLSDGELHRPERTGEGDPNGQSIFSVQDGQYYQDTLTGDVWRYVQASESWERLLKYDRGTGLITNSLLDYDITTSRIGEVRANLEAGSTVSSIDAYLFTQVRQGEDILIHQQDNIDNVVTFTVSADNDGGETTISVQDVSNLEFDLLVGSPIKLEAGLLSVYQSADPTKIYNSISEERKRISIGTISTPIANGQSVSSLPVTRETSSTLSLRDGQTLYVETKDGIGQFVTVNGDQTFNTSSATIVVDSFTTSTDYLDGESYVLEPSWASTTQITQTANTVTILSQTVSETSNAVASINTRTGTLEADVTALAEVTDGQNTSIATAQLTASDAYAAANLAAIVNDGQNTSIASVNTLATNALAIATLAATVNDGQNTSIASVNTIATNALAIATLSATVNDGQNTSIASVNTIATNALAVATLAATVNDGQNTSIASVNTIATNALSIATLSATVNDGQNTAIASVNTLATNALAIATLAATVNDGQNTSIASVNTIATNALSIATLAATVNDGQNTSIASVNTIATNALAVATLAATVNDGQNSAIASVNTIATDAYAAANLSVKYENATGYVKLIAGQDGSEITLQANQINISGIITAVNEEGTTQIDGGKIETGTITATEINVADLFAESIDVGNVIKSSGFSGTDGFAVYSNGRAIFRDVVIDGTSVTVNGSVTAGTGSSIDGTYVDNINAGTINVGTLDAGVIDVINLNASLITSGTIDAGRVNTSALFTGSVTVSGNVSTGDSSSPMVFGVNQHYGIQEIGDGIKIDANNYWLYSTSEDLPVFRVGDTSNYVLWNQFGLQVRGTLNASDITSGTIDVSRLDVSEILGESATISNTLTINSLGQISLGSSVPRIELSDGGIRFVGVISNSSISADYDSDTKGDYVDFGMAASFLNPVYFESDAIINSDAVVSGNVQASYKSDDGTLGISNTIVFTDSSAQETHNVVIKNGIITQWLVT